MNYGLGKFLYYSLCNCHQKDMKIQADTGINVSFILRLLDIVLVQ